METLDEQSELQRLTQGPWLSVSPSLSLSQNYRAKMVRSSSVVENWLLFRSNAVFSSSMYEPGLVCWPVRRVLSSVCTWLMQCFVK
jgi:hypothetical protein